jgi:hypothetical protein
MISEKVGLPPGSESQHSSINLHEDQDGSHKILGYSLEVLPLILVVGQLSIQSAKIKLRTGFKLTLLNLEGSFLI